MKLSKEEIIAIHDYYIEKYGGLYGIRDDNLLESQVESPYQIFAGEDLFSSDFDKAVRYMFGFATNQIFIDGNKRTSVVFANHYLISKGKGLIVVPDKKVDEYKKLLMDFYESNNSKPLSEFLRKECYTKL